jgi:hypothetical protein
MPVMLRMASRAIRFLMARTVLRAKRVKMAADSVSRGSSRTTIRAGQGAVAGLAEHKLAARVATADPSAPAEVLRGALTLISVMGLRRRPASPVRMGIRPLLVRLLALAEPPAAAKIYVLTSRMRRGSLGPWGDVLPMGGFIRGRMVYPVHPVGMALTVHRVRLPLQADGLSLAMDRMASPESPGVGAAVEAVEAP